MSTLRGDSNADSREDQHQCSQAVQPGICHDYGRGMPRPYQYTTRIPSMDAQVHPARNHNLVRRHDYGLGKSRPYQHTITTPPTDRHGTLP